MPKTKFLNPKSKNERKKNEVAKAHVQKKLRGLSDKKRTLKINSLIEQQSKANASGTKVTKGSATKYERDYILANLLKEKHKNECQICTSTFETKNNGYYSEEHHIKPLNRGGLDIEDNILITCPTCHRKLHYASRKIIRGMIDNAKRLTSAQKGNLKKILMEK